MFDPTVFENLKVAIENQVYDLDNLDEIIRVTDRVDRLELSVMAREFALQFVLIDHPDITAEIRLDTSLKDLAAEILEMPGETPACTLRIRFYMKIENPDSQCERIAEVVRKIWEPELPAVQTLSFEYGQNRPIYQNTVELRFNRRINEDQMEDIPNLLDHMLQTLAKLGKLGKL
ncbi:hypothetical protein [Paenibacillus terrigena]|uniref:hypothetical protein n=1 Tax=Paenibacillus terrigena TaxID=369333 RepID=UPI0003702202|nr:hypothetical protein [Paenibacillus terrigena]